MQQTWFERKVSYTKTLENGFINIEGQNKRTKS